MKFRKFLAGVLSASMLSMMCPGTFVSQAADESAETFLYGDVDGSGSINTLDRIIFLYYTAGVMPELTNKDAGDVNLDGCVDECDIAALNAYLKGSVDSLPVVREDYLDAQEFILTLDDGYGYKNSSTVAAVNVYLTQPEGAEKVIGIDAMHLSIDAGYEEGFEITRVAMNSGSYTMESHATTCEISLVDLVITDPAAPIVTLYLNPPDYMPDDTYDITFNTDRTFIGSLGGAKAENVAFDDGSILISNEPGYEGSTVATIATTEPGQTTTSEETETDVEMTETDFPEQTDFVPDTTETVDTTADPVETEQTTATETTDDPYERTLTIRTLGKTEYIVGEELDLSGFTASVFSEAEGYLVFDESIANSKYFKVDDSSFYPTFPGVYRIYVYYADDPQAMAEFDVEVLPADTTETTETTTSGPIEDTQTETTETTPYETMDTTTTSGPVEDDDIDTTESTTYSTTLPTTESTTGTNFDPAGTVVTTETTYDTTLPATETTAAYTTNMYTDEDGVVCFEYCANVGDTILVDETYAGLPYVITAECASYENGIITAVSAGEFYMDFFASDALTEKVAHVSVRIFAEPDETTATDPVWTETTISTTYNTTLPTTGGTTTTSDPDQDGSTADTTADSEVIGTETTTASTDNTPADTTEIAPEEPVGTETTAEPAPDTTETTASEPDTEDTTTTEPEENLPQTGNPAWFGWMLAGTVLLMTAGGWMMMQSGIFRKDEE